RVEGEGLAELDDGPSQVPPVVQGGAEAVVGQDVVRVDLDRVAEMDDGPLQVTAGTQGAGEDVVGQGEVRLEGDGLLVLRDRSLQVPPVLEDIAESVTGHRGERWVELKGGLVMEDGPVVVLPVAQCVAEVEMRQDELRVQREGPVEMED